jgi:hypothetical protein
MKSALGLQQMMVNFPYAQNIKMSCASNCFFLLYSNLEFPSFLTRIAADNVFFLWIYNFSVPLNTKKCFFKYRFSVSIYVHVCVCVCVDTSLVPKMLARFDLSPSLPGAYDHFLSQNMIPSDEHQISKFSFL